MKKQIQIFILALAVTLLSACGGEGGDAGSVAKSLANIDTKSPDGAMMSVIQSIQNNDIKALIQASMSKEEYATAVAEFDKMKLAPSESDKAQFVQVMGMLTADGAEDQLMAMAGPQLEQARAQLPMLLMMGKGMISQGIQASGDVPEEQKELAIQMANAAMNFVSDNDILSEEVTRKAISAAVATAKSLNMSSLDDLQNMSFDDAMGKAGLVMAGTKNILGAYGISLDDMLGSVKVSDVNTTGDNATMQMAYDFLGESFKQEVKMLKKNGKWVAEK